MYDFESIVGEILETRAEMDRDQVMVMVEEKKKNVGGGYLTDQGALFLVAGELGVKLNHLTSSDLTLKDLYVGANDITIVARVLAVYPISEYKKKDGTAGRYRKVNLFDQAVVTRLTIWDDNPGAMVLKDVSLGTPVRVMNGYVRQGLDNRPSLNVGRKGKIEIVADSKIVSKLATLEKVTVGLDEMTEGNVVSAISGTVASNSRRSTFLRADGSEGSLTQFHLLGREGQSKRVVVWDSPQSIDVRTGEDVIITNIRLRKSQGEVEIHGDAGTVVRKVNRTASHPLTFMKVNQIGEALGPFNLEVMVLSGGGVKEVQMRDGSVVKKAELLVGDDTGEIPLIGWRDMADALGDVETGERIRVIRATKQVSQMGMSMLEFDGSSKIEKV